MDNVAGDNLDGSAAADGGGAAGAATDFVFAFLAAAVVAVTPGPLAVALSGMPGAYYLKY